MKLTVRTLDSQNHTFELENNDITVKEFKEHIATTVNIPVEKQRIIFQVGKTKLYLFMGKMYI